ncbi:MAG: shikimate kinase [Methanobacterium sp.]|uniref:shikimate kinase n=1 Tax=Methanobacterium sp. TaxID=2164 RepID=UPI003D65A69D|nr:shikimate kinase [Methanobacterium sp.]
MKTIVKSPGSATVINAIATGCGSAFGIKRYVTAEVELKADKIICKSDKSVDTSLMELCVQIVLQNFDIDTGVRVKTFSDLPVASGLSSSSATSNAVTLATVLALLNEYDSDQVIDDFGILNMAIDASLEAGVTITGAFDDASASFFGGLTVTDNVNRKILKKERMEEQNILIYMPDKKSLTAQSDIGKMKLLSPYVKLAFDQALKGDIYKALTLNGLLYCAALEFNPNIAIDALNAGAIAAGLSGTGPSFVAITDNNSLEDVLDVWGQYEGEVIHTDVDNEGTNEITS